MAFKPLHTTNSTSQNYGQVNDMVRQLNKEQQVKTFKQPGGNAVIQGKLPVTTTDGRAIYGELSYDLNGIPRKFEGSDPDGNYVFAISKPGENVLDALGF